MKRSEAITKYASAIEETMVERYRTVLECNGSIQYKIYVWEDGEIECQEGPHGDNGYLQAKNTEPRELFYVCTVAQPFYDPWDSTDHAAPDDEDEREAERQDIIDWEIDCYRESLSDRLDAIIEEAEQEESFEV